jgi:hypothetical protein
VNKVVNELKVVPSSRKDAVQAKDDDLEQAIDSTLSKRDDLRGSNIDVEVANGVARLTGTVENEQQRMAAAVAARSTPGVKAVKEELRVSETRGCSGARLAGGDRASCDACVSVARATHGDVSLRPRKFGQRRGCSHDTADGRRPLRGRETAR